MHDVVIIGGGVIGLSIGCELAGQGVSVVVLERGQFGRESSWAGAGILPPGNPAGATTAEARLRAASHVLWPDWSELLKSETGIDNGYRPCGGLEVRLSGPAGELDQELTAWQTEGVTVAQLKNEAIWNCEPELSPSITSAYRLPEMGQVRNPRHLRALTALALARGVQLCAGAEAAELEIVGGRVCSVRLHNDRVVGGTFVIAGGAWSSRLLQQVGCHAAVRPLRGQIVLLSQLPAPIRHVINVGPRYLVPRDDGRILIGATEEVAGFDKRTTASGARGLLDFGLELVPGLRHATLEQCWAGLRPQSADGLPYMGQVNRVANLFAATGHFRAGLQLSPVTATLLTRLILKQPPPLPPEPYAPDRHSTFPGFGDPADHATHS